MDCTLLEREEMNIDELFDAIKKMDGVPEVERSCTIAGEKYIRIYSQPEVTIIVLPPKKKAKYELYVKGYKPLKTSTDGILSTVEYMFRLEED